MNDLSPQFQALTNERSNRAIANAIGYPASTVNRQLTGVLNLSVDLVVTICRHYRLDFAEAFVLAGFITREEAESFADGQALRRVSDLDLAREIVRRLEEGEATAALTDPIDVGPSAPIPIRRNVGDTMEDLDAVARPIDPEPDEEQ